MYDYDLELIKSLTNTTTEVRERLAKYWSRQAEQVQIEAFKLAFDLIRQSGIDSKDKLPEVFFCFFIQALSKMHHYETGRALRKKTDGSDFGELKKISTIRIERLKASKKAKSSPKATKLLLQYGELVKKLRSMGFGWRKVSHYLKRYNRLDVSHQTLYRVFGENPQSPE